MRQQHQVEPEPEAEPKAKLLRGSFGMAPERAAWPGGPRAALPFVLSKSCAKTSPAEIAPRFPAKS